MATCDDLNLAAREADIAVRATPGYGLWLLSHVDLRTTARLRIFKNFLLEELKKKTVLLEGALF